MLSAEGVTYTPLGHASGVEREALMSTMSTGTGAGTHYSVAMLVAGPIGGSRVNDLGCGVWGCGRAERGENMAWR